MKGIKEMPRMYLFSLAHTNPIFFPSIFVSHRIAHCHTSISNDICYVPRSLVTPCCRQISAANAWARNVSPQILTNLLPASSCMSPIQDCPCFYPSNVPLSLSSLFCIQVVQLIPIIPSPFLCWNRTVFYVRTGF